MKDHQNKGIVLRQTRVYVHILTHCMGNYELMNISCCKILESSHRIGVNVSLIMGPKEQILPLLDRLPKYTDPK